MLPKRSCLALSNSVLQISWKLALGCNAWKRKKEKLTLVIPKLKQFIKRHFFLIFKFFGFCEQFPVLKVFFKKDLKFWSYLFSWLPASFLLLSKMPQSLFLAHPKLSHLNSHPAHFQHQNRTLQWPLYSPSVSQEASECHLFTHSFIILFNKLIRICWKPDARKIQRFIHSLTLS